MPYIFSLDPEAAHDLAIKSLKFNILLKSMFSVDGEEMLETNLFDEKIPNPIGLAAGFDKVLRSTTLYLNLVMVCRGRYDYTKRQLETQNQEYLDWKKIRHLLIDLVLTIMDRKLSLTE